MKQIITHKLAAEKNAATMAQLQKLSLSDLFKLKKINNRKSDDLRNEMDYMINADFSGDIDKARKKSQEYHIKNLLIEVAIERHYLSVFSQTMNIPSTEWGRRSSSENIGIYTRSCNNLSFLEPRDLHFTFNLY